MPGPLKCPTCAKTFRKTTALQAHGSAKQHDVSGVVTVFTCSDCSTAFSTAEAFRSHAWDKLHGIFKPTRATQNQGPSASSSTGPGPVSSPAAAVMTPESNHMPMAVNINAMSATNPGPVTNPTTPSICNVCDLVFASKSEIDTHYKRSFAHPSRGQCAQCFQDKVHLSRHLKAVHKADICICGATIELAVLSAHYRESPIHPKCSDCRSAFRDAAELREHQSSEHSEHCIHCGQRCLGNQSLLQHYYDSYRHPHCVNCEVGFAGREEYLEHLATIHTPAAALKSTSKAELPIVGVESPRVSNKMPSKRLPSRKQDTDIEDDAEIVSLAGLRGAVTMSRMAQHRAQPHLEVPQAKVETATSDSARQSRRFEGGNKAAPSEVYEHINSVEQWRVDACAIKRHDSASACSTEAVSEHNFIDHAPHSNVAQVVSSSSTGEYSVPPSDAARAVEPEALKRVDHLLSSAHATAPCSDACTFGRSTRASSFSSFATTTTGVQSTSPRAALPSMLVFVPSVPMIPSLRPMTASSVASEQVSTEPTVTASGTTRVGEPAHASAPPMASRGDTPQARPSGPSWHCRVCGKDPCQDPTATLCGHIFCHRCIVKEIADNLECPVCHKMFLLKLQA